MVICNKKQCYYHDKDSPFCLKQFPALDQLGMCTVHWRKGQMIQPIEELLGEKKEITIVEGIVEEEKCQQE